ncbi:MAG: DM13 domain-containing protein [Bacteroidia bacterium]|nr:DM13 domain-containing protein [Bacteroidia bacterium]
MTRGIFSLATLLFAVLFVSTSCTTETVTIDSSLPNGTLTVAKTGTLVAENGTPTAGTVELGADEDNVNFLRFGDDFTTELATGTVSVYFSTSETFTADPGNGNPDLMLVGAVQGNGEQFFKLDSTVPSNFTHVILWCNTASIPFGNGQLQ